MALNYSTWGWAGPNYNERIFIEITQIARTNEDIVANRTKINYRIYNNSNNSYGDTGAINWTIKANSNNVASGNRTNTPTTGYGQVKEYANSSFYLYHNNDGTLGNVTFKLDISRAIGNIKSTTVSVVLNISTIPRASTPTLVGYEQYLTFNLTINTNPASENFRHTLKYIFGNQSGTIATSVGSSFLWTLPANLANGIPNAPSGWGSIVCETYNGTDLIGVKNVSFTAIVPNNSQFIPSGSITSITEGDSSLANFENFIRGKSMLRVQSEGTAKYGAGIKEIKVSVNGGNYYGSDITTSSITAYGNVPIIVLITDTRGYSISLNTTINVLDYHPPHIDYYRVKRDENDSINALTEYFYSVAPLNNKNYCRMEIYYRVAGTTNWTFLFGLDEYEVMDTMTTMWILNVDNSYEFEMRVTDSFATAVKRVNVGTSFTLLDFRNTGRGVAVGKVSEKDAFEVAMPMEVSGQIYQNDGVEVMNGNVGRLPAGDLNSPTYWSSVKDGVYYTDSSNIWTNSKGAWHIYQKITTTSGWGRVFNYAGGSLRVGNMSGTPLQFTWYTYYSNDSGLLESGRIRAYQSPVIVGVANGINQITFNTTSHLKNPNGYVTVGNNGFYCNANGTVRVSFDITWITPAFVGYLVASIRRNNEEFARTVEQTWANSYGSTHVEVITQVASGQYFRFFLENQTAGTINVFHSTQAQIEYIAYD